LDLLLEVLALIRSNVRLDWFGSLPMIRAHFCELRLRLLALQSLKISIDLIDILLLLSDMDLSCYPSLVQIVRMLI